MILKPIRKESSKASDKDSVPEQNPNPRLDSFLMSLSERDEYYRKNPLDRFKKLDTEYHEFHREKAKKTHDDKHRWDFVTLYKIDPCNISWLHCNCEYAIFIRGYDMGFSQAEIRKLREVI